VPSVSPLPVAHCQDLPFLPLYSLGWNEIDVEGVVAIGEALKHNKTLTELRWVCRESQEHYFPVRFFPLALAVAVLIYASLRCTA
jgi:hypothetical protein